MFRNHARPRRHLARLSAVALLLALALAAVPRGASAAVTLPSGFSSTTFANGLALPTAMAFAPDGRIFVSQQGGQLRVIKNGQLLATPFVSLTVSSSGERGLLGIAFDPAFTTNHFVYVYYTATTPNIHNRVSRFTANGDVAMAGSELQLLNIDPLSSATNHNGGALHFGPGGKLFISVGENANGANAQTLSNLKGKVLRLNSDGTIPADNPFYNQASGQNRAIWALGLRNPYTFDFQPGTQRMLINDVGQNTWEEINDGVAGSNYGWPTYEGFDNGAASFRDPLYEYGHGSSSTTGCAITGGAFYNPSTQLFPASYTGKYFFADFCGNWVRLFNPVNNSASAFATGFAAPVDLRVTSDGSLYVLERGAGSTTGYVRRIAYAAPVGQEPSITSQPQSRSVTVGQSATFSVAASGTAPLHYQWQRNGANIANATASSYTVASTTTALNGSQYRCVATNAYGAATSNAATLTVTAATGQLMWVKSVDLAAIPTRGGYNLIARVVIQQLGGSAVAGAQVTVKLTDPNGATTTLSGTTSTSGTVTVQRLASLHGTYTVTVTSITKAGWTYDPSRNVETAASVTV